jgi:multicomponent Na+:H+ antiporter subunit E
MHLEFAASGMATPAPSNALPAAAPGRRWLQRLFLGLGLFGFWVVLSGKLDAFHLGAGALAAAAVVQVTRPLLDPRQGAPHSIPWLRLLAFLPSLLWEIFRSNFQVAAIVLHPRLPISPELVRFRLRFENPAARLTLANAITLTPGTVTVDFVDDEYLVHALTEAGARSVRPEGEEGRLDRRIARVFGEREEVPVLPDEAPPGGPRP